MIYQKNLQITTEGRGFYNLDQKFHSLVHDSTIITGICHGYVPHIALQLLSQKIEIL